MLPVLRTNGFPVPMAAGPINRLDSFFDRYFAEDGGHAGRAWSRFPMGMWEDDDHVFIEAELPGVAIDDVDLTVHNGTLAIRVERKQREGRRYLYDGRTYGRTERVITLPEAVKTDDVEATLADGVLSVKLTKSPEAKPRKIAIRAN